MTQRFPRTLVAWLLIAGVMASAGPLVSEQTGLSALDLQSADAGNPITVIDDKGQEYQILSLTAEYTAGGNWIGSRPKRNLAALAIVLSITENRITTNEDIEIQFATVRRLVFQGAEVPNEFKAVFKGTAPLRIERRDGSIVLLSYDRFIELDAQKAIVRNLPARYSYKAGEAQGQAITLDGFRGRAKTSAGKEGDFWITLHETKSIEFK